MSYSGMLQMRCDVMATVETQVDGLPSVSWQAVAENVPCFLDLYAIRPGKDPVWNPDTGTAQNRQGVLFINTTVDILPGYRIKMITGPSGVFQIDSAVDEVWKPRKLHHKECHVAEVDRALASS